MGRWIGIVVCLIGASCHFGCDEGLENALADVRINAPEVCKNYCEDQTICEWKGDVEDELDPSAYANEIRRCTISCAYTANDGFFAHEVPEEASDSRIYSTFITGPDFIDALDCFYNAVSSGCDDDEGLFFTAINSVQCELAEACYEDIDADIHYKWESLGSGEGRCLKTGNEDIDFHP